MARRRKRTRVGKVVGRAAQTPGNLLLAGGTLLGAPLVGSWWVLMVGLMAFLVSILAKVRDPRFVKEALSGRDPADRALPPPAALHDATLRALAAQIRVGRTQVGRVIADMPDDLEAQVTAALSQLEEMEATAALLLRRADALGRWLDSVDRNAIRAEIARIEQLIGRTDDAATRRMYIDAQLHRAEQLHTLEEVSGEHERATAALLRVAALVEGLPARLMRLKLLGVQAREDLVDELDEIFQRVHGELGQAEQSLRTVLADGAEAERPLLEEAVVQ